MKKRFKMGDCFSISTKFNPRYIVMLCQVYYKEYAFIDLRNGNRIWDSKKLKKPDNYRFSLKDLKQMFPDIIGITYIDKTQVDLASL